MVSLPQDGLELKWKGFVFCNPPYSKVGPWVDKMVEHGYGILSVSAKSPDSLWGNKALKSSSLVLFIKRRIKFYYLSGEQSKGRILPNALVAFGDEACERLLKLKGTIYDGVFMRSVP